VVKSKSNQNANKNEQINTGDNNDMVDAEFEHVKEDEVTL